MFQGTLLESSPVARKWSRWPMATGFTLQMIIASALVIVPLLSTGIIPLSSHTPIFVPIYTPIANTPIIESGTRSTAPSFPRTVVAVTSSTHSLINPFAKGSTDTKQASGDPSIPNVCVNCPSTPGIMPGQGGHVIPLPPVQGPVKVSHLSEGMLLNKVLPVYPRIAIPTGVQGDVKLHAIISRQGTIESLSVISGHPLLNASAIDAVSQWKYRPYLLNGERVEVETYITVTFTKLR